MTVKEDLRVKKTKNALNDAFSELITGKAFEDISINELCQKAGIRRATFYKHYKDKHDFFREYVGFLRFSYDTSPDTVSHFDEAIEYYVNYAKGIVEYISSHEMIINKMLGSNQLHIIVDLIAEKNYNDTRDKLQANADAGMRLPASVENVSAMLIGGVATVIFRWLASGKKTDVETLKEEVAVLVKNVLVV